MNDENLDIFLDDKKGNEILDSLQPKEVVEENLDDTVIFDQEIPISTSTEIEEKNITNADVMSSMNINLSEVERFDNPNIILKNERHISTEEELLEIFIGNNYKKLVLNKLNIFALIFNMFYYMYRKLYLYGILMFLINLIIIYFTKNIMISLIVYGIYSLISLFIFNKLYVKSSKIKIKKLKNRGVNFIEDSCLKMGGTNILVPTIFIILYISFSAFIFLNLISLFNL